MTALEFADTRYREIPYEKWGVAYTSSIFAENSTTTELGRNFLLTG